MVASHSPLCTGLTACRPQQAALMPLPLLMGRVGPVCPGPPASSSRASRCPAPGGRGRLPPPGDGRHGPGAALGGRPPSGGHQDELLTHYSEQLTSHREVITAVITSQHSILWGSLRWGRRSGLLLKTLSIEMSRLEWMGNVYSKSKSARNSSIPRSDSRNKPRLGCLRFYRRVPTDL